MSSLEVHVHKQLAAIARSSLGAFLYVDPQPQLAGPTIAIKDSILVKGMPCSASSHILRGYVAPYDATAVSRLRGKFTILGKTAHDSFCAGGSGISSDFGIVRHPFLPGRVPGGSSSGSAVAVAAKLCDVALGSDTFGSVRAPAAFCGIAGFRPSYGLVSRHGLIDLCMSLDTIGVLARDVRSIALVLSEIAGHDPKDQTTIAQPIPRYEQRLGTFTFKGARIGLLTGLAEPAIEKCIAAAAERMAADGAAVSELRADWLTDIVPVYYFLMFAEFSSAMQRYDGMRYGQRRAAPDFDTAVAESRSLLGPEVKRRILLGTLIALQEHGQKWYSLARKGRAVLAARIAALLQEFDFLVSPTMPTLPWNIGEKQFIAAYEADVLTGIAPLAGLPALSLPCRTIEGMPVGLHIMGKRFADAAVLQAGHRMEELL